MSEDWPRKSFIDVASKMGFTKTIKKPSSDLVRITKLLKLQQELNDHEVKQLNSNLQELSSITHVTAKKMGPLYLKSAFTIFKEKSAKVC